MNPWVESCVWALAGLLAGIASYRGVQARPGLVLWLTGPALAGVLAVGGAVRFPELASLPAWGWLAFPPVRFAVAAVLVPVVLMAPAACLPRRRDRAGLALLAAAGCLAQAAWPALSMGRARAELARLETRWDRGGVCRQGTDYTCGPAAAVTALRRLGVVAGEGELALAAGTSPATGTPPEVLARVLRQRFAGAGVEARVTRWRDASELDPDGVPLALMRFGLMLDHWVVVVGQEPGAVWVADPLLGLERRSWAEFHRDWRRVGVVVKRNRPGSDEGNSVARNSWAAARVPAMVPTGSRDAVPVHHPDR